MTSWLRGIFLNPVSSKYIVVRGVLQTFEGFLINFFFYLQLHQGFLRLLIKVSCWANLSDRLTMSASTGSSPPGHSSGLGPSMSMFRWLEVLEKEFDKAFVDVDLLLGEIDPDQVDITYEGRQKMTSLSSCFAQLCHKTQTVFQLNHKLEVSWQILACF